ncbi:hypothetical protein BVC80_6939g2 [Macleaya cordata]|uniref:Uncharacterized protein n=1 Tax=Macleaya cordata TaxID=56857 RepID=A0A200Q418_MACCD|nr:hypothetical protein BVC80_6939g2 [Macleaya cordata]
MGTSCFCCDAVKDVKPRSVALDGFPPEFLRQKGWDLYMSNSKPHQLGEASGLNLSLRMWPPELDFSTSNQYSTTVVVGKWYCPFVFIRENNLRYQMKNSLFYKMTLEQFWEEIYKCENDNYTPAATGNKNIVAVSASVQKESVKLFGEEAVKDDKDCGVDGFVWFRNVKHNKEGLRLGLSLAIVEKMRWIQEKGGYEIGGGESRDDVGRVEKVEEFKGENGWRRFGCFVLVERFALRRMDGKLLLTWDYNDRYQNRFLPTASRVTRKNKKLIKLKLLL